MSIYNSVAGVINRSIARLGYRVIRLPSPPWNCRLRAIETLGIDLVFDVGANTGQYAQELRAGGYRGEIISFEPLPDAFAAATKAASADGRWTVRNCAVGAEASRMTMNVADNSVSSSLLTVTATSVGPEPGSRIARQIEVDVITLASELAAHDGRRILLKLDTQGYELPALRGCGAAIDAVTMLDVEMSIVSMYEGQPLFDEVDAWIGQHPFRRLGFDTGLWNRETGQLLQLDGLYARR